MSEDTLHWISLTLGWLYFFCWSFSFYPQAIANFRTKSVTGLSVDFVIASFYGFLCYTIANVAFYCVQGVREAYRQLHDGKDHLVAINDVIFAAHAMLICGLFCWQVYLYRKVGEGPSPVGITLAITLTLIIVGGGALACGGQIQTINYLYGLSYIKIILTIVKYIPQAWMNWVRRSTSGWSIVNVLLDFSGGIFSMAQLFLDAMLTGHLDGIMGFMTKWCLAIISILFDTIFILQHYLWFKEGNKGSRTIISPRLKIKQDQDSPVSKMKEMPET